MKSESIDDIFDVHFEKEVIIRTTDTRKARWVEEEEIFSSVCIFIFPELREWKSRSVEIEENFNKVAMKSFQAINKGVDMTLFW